MPIPFTCPHCGQETTVDDQYAGRTGPCAECGETITVPGLKGESIPPRPAAQQYLEGMLPRKSSNYLVIIIVCVVVSVMVIGGLLALLFPAVQAAQEAERRMICTSNMKMLTLSMHNYHDAYRQFPLAAGPFHRDSSPSRRGSQASSEPKSWSWRVCLLQFNEQSALYDEFHFDEPWDSEHNLTIAETMPSCYQCPSDTMDYKEVNGHLIPVTNYVMVTGEYDLKRYGQERHVRAPGVVFPKSAIRLASCVDGTSNTFFIVEVTGEDRPAWTEPVDIALEDLLRGVNAESGMSIGSRHPGGANVAMCDGSIRFLPNRVDPEQLLLMGAMNDGCPINWDMLNNE